LQATVWGSTTSFLHILLIYIFLLSVSLLSITLEPLFCLSTCSVISWLNPDTMARWYTSCLDHTFPFFWWNYILKSARVCLVKRRKLIGIHIYSTAAPLISRRWAVTFCYVWYCNRLAYYTLIQSLGI
jgi:hypothetical protein